MWLLTLLAVSSALAGTPCMHIPPGKPSNWFPSPDAPTGNSKLVLAPPQQYPTFLQQFSVGIMRSLKFISTCTVMHEEQKFKCFIFYHLKPWREFCLITTQTSLLPLAVWSNTRTYCRSLILREYLIPGFNAFPSNRETIKSQMLNFYHYYDSFMWFSYVWKIEARFQNSHFTQKLIPCF